MENSHYYRSLTRNMVLSMILVSFAPLILITGIIGYAFETSYREKALAHLREMVQKHQQNIDGFLNDKLSYIQVLANSYTYDQLADEKFLEKKLAILQQAYSGVFVDLGLVDGKGLQVAYAGTFRLEKADYSKSEWFRAAIERDFFISDVFLGLRRLPHFIVAVKRKRGNEEYMLRATIDFVFFNSLVESIHIGKTGTAFIINRRGEFQTKPRGESAQNAGFFMSLLSNPPPEPYSVGMPETEAGAVNKALPHKALAGSSVVGGEASYDGKDFVYMMTPLKSGEWLLAYRQDAADAFEDLRYARILAFSIFAVGGFAIIFMALFQSKRVVQRIERADREKEMMNEQVIEAGKMASIGELAAGIAHEINNPVAIMVEEAGWIEDLLQEEDLEQSANLEEFKRALQQINTQGERCKQITHKLLSFARKTDPTLREVLVNELIEEIISISEQRSKFSNVKIGMNLAPDLPLVSASPSELQQVILNLINNAIDAIGTDGGTIDITTRTDRNYVAIDVADSGHGIPEAIMSRMFDPFFTTKPVGKGTGLGLSICYGIIKKMGGEISVNSAVGIGSVFHVYIPFKREE